ncbi:hypothetical protein V2J09_005331 [Rumex salicifolius]
MILELLPSENLPSNEAVIICEGVKQCDKPSNQTGELHHRRGEDKINCFRLLKEMTQKDENALDYNEVIAYWMMEGYLGHVDSVEEAYRKGHDIFMEFKYVKIPRSELHQKRRFNNMASVTSYERYRGFYYSTLGVGFVDVFDFGKGETPMLGKLVPDEGVVRTYGSGHCKCLLLDGNRLDRQVIKHFTKHLQSLAYFNPRTNLLNSLVANKLLGKNLTVLILRGCAFLEKIEPSIGDMSPLTILEISGPSSIKTIPDIFLKLTNLRSLNLSYLGIDSLPRYTFPKLIKLRWLILRGCTGLRKLPSTRDMANLEVIDLFGATSLEKLSTTNFRGHPIKMLDLSNTHVKRVPCLYNRTTTSATVTHLFLKNISEIYVFDIVGKLVSLQVLDVSGAVHLKQIDIEPLEHLVVLDLSGTSLDSLPKSCFKKLSKVTDLNLSNINITELPEISHLSKLQVLNLSGCKKLEGLGDIPFGKWPSLLSLNLSDTNLEKFTILDTSGASSSHHHLEQLQILNLSNTKIQELPSFSQLKSLIELHLAGCSELASLIDLESLTELDVLDLSGTKVEKEVLDKAPSGLKKLLFKGCSLIKGALHLKSFTLLQELDLRGTDVEEFPEDIVTLTRLNRLCLPHGIRITGVEWSRIKDKLPNEIIWDQPINIFESVNVVISNRADHSMSAKPSKEDQLFHLVDTQDSWEAYLKQFQFSAVSPKEEDKDAVMSSSGVELVFKGNHPLARKPPYFKPQSPSVEIHGFSCFPEDAKTALEKAVNVALVGNSFFSSLSDQFIRCMKVMEVCWINSCSKMEVVIVDSRGSLETIVLSNLESLRSFSGANVLPYEESESLKFKHVYIDCCPVLSFIFAPSLTPRSLETLHIKFCDELETVCNGDSELPNLHELSLLGLPKLQRIGAELPSLQNLTISQCPEFNVLGRILESAGSRLTRLSLDSCPQLVHVFSSSMVMENIQELEIRSCDNMKVVFDSAEAASSSSSSTMSLPGLKRLQLWNLPKLKSIGGGFPSLEACEIKYCSRLPRDLWPQVKKTQLQ